MYRSYLSIYYSMLTRGRSFILNHTDSLIGLSSRVKIWQVPFTCIAERQSAFFATKYLPCGLHLDHPRTVKRDDIIKFFEHIGSWQASHGVKDAFRFKQYLSSCKKGTLMPAKYPDQIWEAPEPELELPEPGAGYKQNLAQSFTFTFQTDQYPAHESIPASTATGPVTASLGHQNTSFLPEPVITTGPGPALTYDPKFFWDRTGNLDPSLDPSYGRPVRQFHVSLNSYSNTHSYTGTRFHVSLNCLHGRPFSIMYIQSQYFAMPRILRLFLLLAYHRNHARFNPGLFILVLLSLLSLLSLIAY